MILNLLFALVAQVVIWVLGLMPEFTSMAAYDYTPGSFAFSAGALVYKLGAWVPTDVIGTVLIVLGELLPLAALGVVVLWLWKHMPFVGKG